ncbi:hypothetical protein SAMN05216276_1017100 [Streptosporangium subroseum]|uniref:Uncharacterized protein n=1 Tax=Streptosporangium subroseum TaxID=106412 RepID=A0A239HRC7_9ACTN|nr:hypothetical protein SAMN05216276_1017100 [Streptosporangium subroseum]
MTDVPAFPGLTPLERQCGPPNRPKPMIVLPDSAWADGSSCSEVIRRLRRLGNIVLAGPAISTL